MRISTILGSILVALLLVAAPKRASAQGEVTYNCMGCYNIGGTNDQGCTNEDPPTGIHEQCILQNYQGSVVCNWQGPRTLCPEYAFATFDDGKNLSAAGTFVPLVNRLAVDGDIVSPLPPESRSKRL